MEEINFTGDEEPSEIENGTTELNFVTDEFSVYSVVSYYVNFIYTIDGKEYKLSLNGGSTVGFRELINALHLLDSNTDTNHVVEVETVEVASEEVQGYDDNEVNQFINNIAKVEFSDESLVKVVKITEDTTAGTLKEQLGIEPEYSPELTLSEIDEMNEKKYRAVDWVLLSLKSFESEEILTVTMKDGEVFTIQVTDPNADGSGTVMDSSNYADVLGDGITVKLFDYSGTVNNNNSDQDIDQVWGNSTNENELKNGTGVNRGRTLLFSGSGMTGQNWWNNFTGDKTGGDYYSGIVTQNIVKRTLGEDGYPVLADNVSSGESLGYLFGAGGQSGVTAYTGADGNGLTGFLQKDENGYYYYDSEQNYARLNGNEIQLYTDTYYKATGSSNSMTQNIGFFPFDDYNSNYTEEKTPNVNGGAAADAAYNHQFGLSLNAKFTYPTNGYLPDANGNPDTDNPMIFNFEGDDDIWIYIDGVLVLDLGGVHSPVTGSINFATGVVTVGEFNSQGVYSYTKNTTIADMFTAAGKTWNPGDYSDHTIDMFYLERGGCDSNLRLSFNLLTRSQNDTYGDLVFDKVDEEDVALEGAKFQLFTNPACTTALTWTVEDETGVKTAIAISTADSYGNVQFEDIPTGNYYMKEIEAPEGYAVSDRVYNVSIVDKAGTDSSTLKYNGETVNKIVNHKLKLTLKKVDDSGTALPGATFSLAYTPADGESSTVTSIPIMNASGLYTINPLPEGNYVLTETSAPDGYTSLDGSISFEVTSSGITMGALPTGVEYDGGDLILTIPNEPETIDGAIKVIKRWVDQNGNLIDGNDYSAKVQLRRYKTETIEPQKYTVNFNMQLDTNGAWIDGVQYWNPIYVSANEDVGGSAEIEWYDCWQDYYSIEVKDNSGNSVDYYLWSIDENNHCRHLLIPNLSTDCNITVKYSSNYIWLRQDGNHWSKTQNVSISGGSGSTEVVNDDSFPTSTDTDATQTLSSENNWIYTWTIGDGSGYDFPATDGTNPYLYYLVEVKSDGTEVSINGEMTDGITLKSITYSPALTSDSPGIQEGIITVTNEVTTPDTIDIVIKKFKKDDLNNASAETLKGATFRLEKYTSSDYQGKDTGWSEQTVEDTEETGIFNFTDLEEGFYKIVEVDTPDGYIKISTDPTFEVRNVSGQLEVIFTDTNLVTYTPENGFRFGNEPGAALPNTGGPGTRLFTILGSILILGAGALLWRRRRFI